MSNTNYQSDYGDNQANFTQYAIMQMLSKVNTILPCKIVEIASNNKYHVQPIINNLDANGNPLEQPIIYDVPLALEMGNKAGVIIELAVDDVVAVGFCQRGMNTAKENWKTSNPTPPRRMFDISDGIILKSLSNTLPTTYVKITKDSVEILSKSVVINAEDVAINANNADINNADVVNINASSAINLKSSSVNIGNGSGSGLLTGATQFNVVVTGVQNGTGTATGTATAVGSTISSQVKAAL